MDQPITNLRSMARGFAAAMNMVADDVENHHEQVAYLSYRIAEEMGLPWEERLAAMYGALLHDAGAVIMGEGVSLDKVESNAPAIARAGAAMMKANDAMKKLANVVGSSQFMAIRVLNKPIMLHRSIFIGQIIQLCDKVSLCISGGDGSVLNRVERTKSMVAHGSGTWFHPKVVKAFEGICDKEYVWMDALYRPNEFLTFIPFEKTLTLDEVIAYSEFMSMIIDFRSPFTAMHSAGVAASAVRLAELFGMSEAECKMMRIAGALHDVGKLRVPRAILEKPGKLTDEEFNVIKEHTYFTYRLLESIDGFDQIAQWAAFHHEKLNGAGYPFKLQASQIPFGSRIMAVADIFSAITEERPYRVGMPKEKVIDVMLENVERGALSAPIVDVLLANFDDVAAAREAEARRAGKRYFDSIAESEKETD